MGRWILSRSSIFLGLRAQKPRCFSALANDVERVNVRNGSSGIVTIDLHNISKISSPDPLLIYLPPYSTAFTDKPTHIPNFIKRYPTAVINYRWKGFVPSEAGFRHPEVNKQEGEGEKGKDEDEPSHLAWPTPIHDTAEAYSWIVKNLSPSDQMRRDIYVYGSYLGASLATSLALTETYPDEQMAIRGVAAFNGIYDWTTFLPDHKIHKELKEVPEDIINQQGGPDFQDLKQHVEALFQIPDNLFDHFASPSLFFCSPGLYVPAAFDASALACNQSPPPEDILKWFPIESPQQHRVVFPPKPELGTKKLIIPETLLLHTTTPLSPRSRSIHRRWQKRKKYPGNNFESQAKHLVKGLRNGIYDTERKGSSNWDGDSSSFDDEVDRRIQVEDAGLNTGDFELGGKGEELAAIWLQEQTAGS
ncbi:hypothetical protein F4804DRAFT_300487 [Jackrogersella minutella]|nr:hypothetical protein F4804DRAFT_300487 [Jackrogersella minutella]